MLAGYLYVLVAVFAWSSYPVLTKIAYGLGLTPLTLGFLRFGLALPVLLLACAGFPGHHSASSFLRLALLSRRTTPRQPAGWHRDR